MDMDTNICVNMGMKQTVKPSEDLRATAGIGRRLAGALDQRGQMAVELAVLLPVIIVVALILFNCLSYLSLCSRFDRLAEQAVRTQATSPGPGYFGLEAHVSVMGGLLDASFSRYSGVSTDVQAQEIPWGSGLVGGSSGATSNTGTSLAFSLLPKQESITCTLKYTPWPAPSTIFGLNMFEVKHTKTLVIDPYRPGVFW